MKEPGHIPVLLDQTIELLKPKGRQTALDCTVGLGGHAKAIIPHLKPGGKYIALDIDNDNLQRAKEKLNPLADASNIELVMLNENFRDIQAILKEQEIKSVDLLLADLGFASAQMDDPKRGFAFSTDGPLDMRLSLDMPLTAADLVNQMGAKELADLIYKLGEEKLSRQIATKIVDNRTKAPIQRTKQLAEIVSNVYKNSGYYKSKIHPATRTFMALRIAVNGELDALDSLLTALPKIMAPGGRAGIISFHSLEDRRVKQSFAQLAKDYSWQRVTRKPEIAREQEAQSNPRSRSAKLRVIDQTDMN